MKKSDSPSAETAPQAVKEAGSDACVHGAASFTLLWTAGLLTAFLHVVLLPVILLTAAGTGAVFLRGKRHLQKRMLWAAAGLLLGSALGYHYDAAVRQPLCSLDGTVCTCTGTVLDVSQRSGDRTVYTLKTAFSGIRTETEWFADAGIPELRIGDTVTLDAELSRIQADYRYHTDVWQAGRGRYLRIYKAELLDFQEDTGFSLRREIRAYRSRLTDRIRAAMPPEEAGLFCAMLFGDKTQLSDETSEALRRTGIGHITAVSGLHLVFFCGVLAWLLQRLSVPKRTVFLLHIPMILLFILLVDSSVSVFRAAVMILLTASAPLFGRHSDTLRSLCIAVLLCTVTAPYVIVSVSFWLSVSGVLGIGVIAPYLTKQVHCSGKMRTLLQLCCVSVSVFPASVLLCGESSLIAPLCNLLILPVCIMALYLGFFYLLTGGTAGFLLTAASALCRFVRVTAGFAGKLPFSHLTVTQQPVRIAVLLCTILLAAALVSRCTIKQFAACLLSAAALVACLNAAVRFRSASELQTAVLGGKSGAALVISANGHTVVAELSDTPRNAQYVRSYLDAADLAEPELLLLGSEKTAAAYQEELPGHTAGTVLIRTPASLRDDETVCGRMPLYAGSGPAKIACGDAEIVFFGDSAEIFWKGLCIKALAEEPEAPVLNAAAVITCGKNGTSLTLSDAAQTVYSGGNLLLRVSGDGKAAVEPLHNSYLTTDNE